MSSGSRNFKPILLEDAAAFLRAQEYEVARHAMVTSGTTPSSVFLADLVARRESALIIIELKMGQVSSAVLLPFFQVARALSKRTDRYIDAILVTDVPLTNSIRQDAEKSKVIIASSSEFPNVLRSIVSRQSEANDPADPRVQVRAYLRKAFPGATVDVFEWVERDSWAFRVRIDHTKHQLLVANEFFEDTPRDQIGTTLKTWKVVEALSQAGDQWVVLTNFGVRHGLP